MAKASDSKELKKRFRLAETKLNEYGLQTSPGANTFLKICYTPLWEKYFLHLKEEAAVRKLMLNMPVPGSFWNIGKEGSDHVKPCGNRRTSIKNHFTHSGNAASVDDKCAKNHCDLIHLYRATGHESSKKVLTKAFSWPLHCNTSVRMCRIILVLWPFLIYIQCIIRHCKLIFDWGFSIFT